MPFLYRIEWPSAPMLVAADTWTLHTDAAAARRAVARMVTRRRRPVPWVRVVLLEDGRDVGDGFVSAADVAGWTDVLALPPATASTPVAAPEIERLRGRALSALDVVLGWSRRRGLLSQMAADEVRLVFDAALVGIVSHTVD
ncbi:hypothetical protein [uncultured Sphingomonas sp.]|uniref:hypothetical protein n=1 Tax=uncultured Sphingomonas sp. TaxID=158754 RepID=UPI003749A2E1